MKNESGLSWDKTQRLVSELSEAGILEKNKLGSSVSVSLVDTPRLNIAETIMKLEKQLEDLKHINKSLKN